MGLARSVPWSWYSDPDVLRLEQERIFRHAWQYVGHEGRAAEVGARFAGWAGDVPVVVVRSEDGLRAFLNVCRHRGSLLVEGDGARASIQCPYHAWTYGLDVTTLAYRGRSRDWVVEANWKVVVENYLECYHCPVAHKAFSAAYDVDPDSYRLEATSKHVLSQFAPAREAGEGQFHFVWPNLKLNAYAGTPNLSIGPLLPAGPERSTGFLDYFFAADSDEQWVEELLAFDRQVGAEDRALVERVQKGVRSGVVEEGRLLGESEQLVTRFQELVSGALS